MRKSRFFVMFLLSGFCSLVYQVVWLRLAFASFGVITPVLSVLVSVFMLGLGAGSWFGARWARFFRNKLNRSALSAYILAEMFIGVGGAFIVPKCFKIGETWLLGLGETGSTQYLFASAVVLVLSLLPWCLLMGSTFPLILSSFEERGEKFEHGFSFLYMANLIGALLGVSLTALVLVEMLGFQGTLIAALIGNLSICWLALSMSAKDSNLFKNSNQSQISTEKSAEKITEKKVISNQSQMPFAKFVLFWLFLSGFCSMGLEVAWSRGFVPVLKTQVYSFAALLFIYLLSTSIGSAIYRRHVARKHEVSLGRLMVYLAIASLAQIFLNDLRVHKDPAGILISLLPFCALLGYLTPRLIDDYSHGDPDKVGKAYAWNAIGCVIGPLISSYALLPVVGVKATMIIFALPFVLFGARSLQNSALGTRFRIVSAASLVVSLLVTLFWAQSYEEPWLASHDSMLRRDHVATVVATGSGMNKSLFVNGIAITHQTPITKMMAHLPLASLDHKPKNALVICFGMGTTWRSLMSWGIDATAVELSQSVVDVFKFFHSDADELKKLTNGHLVVDDGRRFLRRGRETFDIITLDPPPPPEAAGSSLLYSEEFYTAVKERLAPNGILQTWYPGGEEKILQAVAHSVTESFPYVIAYKSAENWGYHFLASMQPIKTLSAEELVAHMPESARKDLVEWNSPQDQDPKAFIQKVLDHKTDPRTLYEGDSAPRITDNSPYNEYYWFRRMRKKIRDRI